MTEVWFDNHPIIADSIILTFPGLIVFTIWVLFGVSIIDSAIQALLTSVILFMVVFYLNKKHNNTVFRYIGNN